MKPVALLVALLLLLNGCATLSLREPLQVSIAGLEPLPSEGLEARFLLKLRVQNPNDVALAYSGLSVDLDLEGRDFATGVTDVAGDVPRFGESVVHIPVTVPVSAILYQILDLTRGKPVDGVEYRLRGRLGGMGIGGVRFDTSGKLALPKSKPQGD